MLKNFKPLFFASLIAVATASVPGSATANQIKFSTEFSISFAGIPVARSKFQTVIDGTALSVSGTLSTAGLATIFDSTRATSVSSGVITQRGVQTQAFAFDYKSGKRSRSTKIRFSDGNAVETAITPEFKPHPNDVPVQSEHLVGVVDPFLASVVFAKNPADVCNRTLKVFDGVLRLNLVMRPAGTQPYVIGETQGNGIKCSVRYEPVSGQRANSKSVSYMAEGERATILFGKLSGTDLYGPVRATIKTKNGTVTIRAVKLEQLVD